MSKYNKNNGRPTGIPTSIMRMDRELMSEIKMYISLGYSVAQAARAYHISESMVKFAIKKGKDFNSLQKDILEESDKNE